MREKTPTIQDRLREDAEEYYHDCDHDLLNVAADHIDDLEKRLYRLPELTEAKCFAAIMQMLAIEAKFAKPGSLKYQQLIQAKQAVDELKVHIKYLKEAKL